MKNNPVFPGGLLNSKPTWLKASRPSATSAFFVLGDMRRLQPSPGFKTSKGGLPMGLVLLILLVVLLMGGLPTWGYSRSWGYGPSGGLGLVLVIVLVLLLMGHIPFGF
jgi:hypothetical protein